SNPPVALPTSATLSRSATGPPPAVSSSNGRQPATPTRHPVSPGPASAIPSTIRVGYAGRLRGPALPGPATRIGGAFRWCAREVRRRDQLGGGQRTDSVLDRGRAGQLVAGQLQAVQPPRA